LIAPSTLRRRISYAIVGVGVAALIASTAIGYLGRGDRVSVMTEIMLTAMFFICAFTAGMMAVKLNKESASK